MGRKRGVTITKHAHTRLSRLLEGASLRDLSADAGVSHFVLWKAANRQPISNQSAAKIQEWLGVANEAQAAKQVLGDLKKLLSQVPSSGRVRATHAGLRTVLADAYEDAGLEVPGWVEDLGGKSR